jgi:hypothetical protein
MKKCILALVGGIVAGIAACLAAARFLPSASRFDREYF